MVVACSSVHPNRFDDGGPDSDSVIAGQGVDDDRLEIAFLGNQFTQAVGSEQSVGGDLPIRKVKFVTGDGICSADYERHILRRIGVKSHEAERFVAQSRGDLAA